MAFESVDDGQRQPLAVEDRLEVQCDAYSISCEGSAVDADVVFLRGHHQALHELYQMDLGDGFFTSDPVVGHRVGGEPVAGL